MSAPKGNNFSAGLKNAEKYTEDITVALFEQARDILVADETILTDTMLMIRCKDALGVPISTYQYLRDDKFPSILGDLKKEIDGILESRVMQSKKMYPGIAAMTLKNKHKWRDQTEQSVRFPDGVDVTVSGELTALVDDIVGKTHD
jgi:hypothetical protein